jgi:hypothetical protein
VVNYFKGRARFQSFSCETLRHHLHLLILVNWKVLVCIAHGLRECKVRSTDQSEREISLRWQGPCWTPERRHRVGSSDLGEKPI